MMPRLRHRPALTGFLLGVACLLTGCGPGEVRGSKLSGKVLMNGQPLKPLPGERVWVTFERTDGGGGRVIMTSGQVQKDGTFAIEGQEKKGTPAGKYSITLNGEYTSGEGENRFAHLFADGKSPFVADVTDPESQSFVIDVGKKTIAKQ